MTEFERKAQEKVKTDVENRKLAISEDLKDVKKKIDVLLKAVKNMESGTEVGQPVLPEG